LVGEVVVTATNEGGYTPIACSLHDQYEAAAVRRTMVEVSWRTGDGAEMSTESRIVDVRVRDGAEFLVLESGEVIRLDHIVSTSLHGRDAL